MMATALPRHPTGPRSQGLKDTVQWNSTAGMAERQMRLAGLESLVVVAGGRTIGRITRRDIERCENRGNWLEAVMVLDLVQDPRDTCN